MMLVSCCASSSLVFSFNDQIFGSWDLEASCPQVECIPMKFTQLLEPGGEPTDAAEKTKRLKDSSLLLFKWLIVIRIVV